MRDVMRIRPFCEELAVLWEKCPDMRFGQLVVNALGANAFYMEDDDTLEKIREFISNPDEYIRAQNAAAAILGEKDVRPYDSAWDMYFDEFDDYTPEDES